MVMYAGQVVESGPTRSVFAAPRHPYTEALVRSTPRLQDKSRTRLTTIPGQPIEVIDPLPACRFAPRCGYARPRCLVEDPPLTNGHAGEVRCFYPVGSDAGATALKENLEAGHTAAGIPATEQP
jgi:peptide/nickel transport system ATP-binding protein